MRLPILVVSEFSFAVRLRIETGLGWPHESLWCKLVKCSRWNRLNAEDLAYVFGASILSRQAMLVYPGRALQRALLHHLALHDNELPHAFPPGSLFELITPSLRGCPRCYRLGFHSPLFQVQALARCPLHGDELVVGCPDCAAPQECAVTANWRSDGPHCLRCGRKFLHASRTPNGTHSSILAMLPRLLRWREMLIECFAHHGKRPPREPSNTARVLGTALREWSQTYVEAMPPWRVRRAPGWKPLILGMPQIESESELFAAAAGRYFRLRRVCRRLVSAAIGRSVDRVMQGRAKCSCLPQSIEALALLLWRLVWERLGTPCDVARPVCMDRTPLGVVLWVATRPLALELDSKPSVLECFHLELIDCYACCRDLAAWLYQHGGMLLSLNALCTLVSAPYLRWHRRELAAELWRCANLQKV